MLKEVDLMSDERLTPRQPRLVDEYGACLNAAEVARRTGYSA